VIKDEISQEIVPNSSVEILDSEGNTITKLKSDDSGEFLFDAKPFEEYTLIASHDGYKTNTVNRNVNSANNVEYYTSIYINKEIEEEKIITKIENIYFSFNSEKLSQESKEALNNMISKIDKPIKNIKLVGHTDYFGNEEYNYVLGLERAKNVMHAILENKSVNIDAKVLSEGEQKPIVICNNCNSKKVMKNRRVEIIIEY
jgi:outer membrane protein OmpA-like peptidoglycan-associated protein